jgi:hypothetical protein
MKRDILITGHFRIEGKIMSSMNIDIEGEMIIDKKDVICDVKKKQDRRLGL